MDSHSEDSEEEGEGTSRWEAELLKRAGVPIDPKRSDAHSKAALEISSHTLNKRFVDDPFDYRKRPHAQPSHIGGKNVEVVAQVDTLPVNVAIASVKNSIVKLQNSCEEHERKLSNLYADLEIMVAKEKECLEAMNICSNEAPI